MSIMERTESYGYSVNLLDRVRHFQQNIRAIKRSMLLYHYRYSVPSRQEIGKDGEASSRGKGRVFTVNAELEGESVPSWWLRRRRPLHGNGLSGINVIDNRAIPSRA